MHASDTALLTVRTVPKGLHLPFSVASLSFRGPLMRLAPAIRAKDLQPQPFSNPEPLPPECGLA
jgi:hypothetical protein